MQSVSQCVYQKRLNEDMIVCSGHDVLTPFIYKVEADVPGVGRLWPSSPHDVPLQSRSPYLQSEGLGPDYC